MSTTTTPDAWTRTLRPGSRTDEGRPCPVFVTIKWNAPSLTLTGVEGPKANGDCVGSSGQITLTGPDRAPLLLAPGWTPDMIDRLQAIWDRWHLNDMRAGSPAQSAYMRAHPMDPDSYRHPRSHYTAACAHLAAAGLNPDLNHMHKGKPFAYGSAWLLEPVPAEILAELLAFPAADKPLPAAWAR
jgi:hypothetical protein